MTEEKRRITIDDLYNINYIEDPRISPDGQWIAYVRQAPDQLKNDYKRTIWLAPTGGGEPVQLTRGDKDSHPRWSPDGAWLAFVSARSEKPQVYVMRVATPGGEARALTDFDYGADSPAWSPDGQQIAFLGRVNAEERAKEDRDDTEEPPADTFEAEQRKARKAHQEKERWDPRVVERIPYRQGTSYMDDRFAQVYVIAADDEDAKPRRLTDIDANHAQPEWTPDGQYILTARSVQPEADEAWRYSQIFRIRAEDGAHEQLTDNQDLNTAPLPSPDGQWVAYLSQPKAHSSFQPVLHVMPAAGGEPVAVSKSLDRSPGNIAWARDGSVIVFSINQDGWSSIQAATPDGASVQARVTGSLDIQNFDVSAEGHIAFAASSPQCPPELFWQPVDAPTDQGERVTHANQWLDAVKVQPTHTLDYQAPDGQKLTGWYILPVGYEEGKQYPLALNIHGGPHAMWSPATRSMWHEWQVHAAAGYVVFYCNPRGSDGYGAAFRRAAVGKWGEADMPDVMAGVDALIEKGLVDPDRLAITGGSYGGFMTAWFIGHTDRFKAAVAQRGVYHMASMFGTTDVPIFNAHELGDLQPWDDPETYWKYSPVAYAHQITTPLLIIHSENDFRVPISEGEQLFAFIRRKGGTVTLIRYPREGHELSRSGEPKHRASRLQEMVAWFDQYCTGA